MLDLDACPCSGRNLDKLLAPAILLQLTNDDLHGYEIVRRLADSPLMAGRKPDAAGVYRILRDMESRGVLAAAWETAETGPAKRTYHLNADGRHCLARWHATLEEHAAALERLLAMMRDALAVREEMPDGGSDVRE
ncbi:MAG: PadR family transcriptional regulator [Planctomycetes bacterium]|nr:PadR family transcriptional regulator [Planctomycetota bacterium]